MKKVTKTKTVNKVAKPEKRVTRIIKLPNKGEDGYTPKKGVDYFDGEPGYTPKKGVDYFDGQTPSKDDLLRIIYPLIPPAIPGDKGDTGERGPEGKQGRPGTPGKSFPKEEVKKMLDSAIRKKMPELVAELEGKGLVGVEDAKEGYNLIIDGKKHFVPSAVYAPKLRNFIQLGDSPGTYRGSAGKVLAVNATEDGIEYIAGGGGAVDSVNGQTGVVALDTDDIGDTATNRYTNDTDITRLANTSGTNTGNQTITNSSDATSHTVTLSASGGSIQLIEGSNITLTTGGTASAGTVTIAATGGSGSPGGSTTQVQFNDGGSFGGDGGFTWDKTTNQLSLGTLSGTQSGAVIFPYGGGLSDTLGGSGVDLDAGGFSAYVNGGGQFSILDNNVGATATLSTASLTADRTYTLPNLGGTVPVVLSAGRPGTSKTNSTIADQDFASIYTIPANTLVANKMIRVTLNIKVVTGTSTATITGYVKLGSTKVITSGTGNIADSSNVSQSIQFYIMGTAAPGASVSVEASTVTGPTPTVGLSGALLNQTSQPVAGIATNGTLNIVYGVQWSATGSTETVTIMSYLVEALN